MKRRLISVFLVIVLLSSFSFALAADSDDAVLDGTGSGWIDSDSGYPSVMANSWWRFIFQWLRGLIGNSNNLKTGWSASSYPTSYANSWYQKVKEDLDNSYNIANGYKTGWVFNTSNSNVNIPSGYGQSSNAALLTGVSSIHYWVKNIQVHAASLDTRLFSINSLIQDIHDVIANETDITMRNNMESSYSSVNDNFMSGTGGSSESVKASSSEYGEVKALGGIIRNLEPSGRDMSHLSGAFGDGDNSLLGWFTSRTAQELNPIMNNNRLRAAGSNDGFVDFLAPNIDLIEGSRKND